jgi:hypothetical protein
MKTVDLAIAFKSLAGIGEHYRKKEKSVNLVT